MRVTRLNATAKQKINIYHVHVNLILILTSLHELWILKKKKKKKKKKLGGTKTHSQSAKDEKSIIDNHSILSVKFAVNIKENKSKLPAFLVKHHKRPYKARHYENMPIQIYWKFYHQKMNIFQIKNADIFHTSAQNIDCRYSLEPPWRGGSKGYPQSMFWAEISKIMYTSVNPSFTI